MATDETTIDPAEKDVIASPAVATADIIQYLPVAVYTCNPEGFITNFNSAAVELWGREPQLGEDKISGAYNLFYPDGSPMPVSESPMARAIRTRSPVLNEQVIVEQPGGNRVLIAPNPYPMYDAAGTYTGCINMLLDITEKQTAEATAARLAAIVQSSEDAIISKTLSGVIMSWNKGAERIFGYTADEMIGQSVLTLIPPDRRQEEPIIIDRLKKGERIEHFETKRLTKSGKLIDISLTISPIKDKEGAVVGASKIARDITAQKNADRLIQESNERFQMAIAATDIGTWDYNIQTGELHWSPECRKIYDVPDDLVVNYDLFSRLIYPEDFDAVQKNVGNAIADNVGYDIEFRVIRYTDGQVRWIRSQGKVFLNDGKPERFIGTVLDITDERNIKDRLEKTVQERTRELEQANKALERSNNELEEFAYVASHDLQEPLRKIKLFADRLLIKGKDTFPADLHEDLSKIISSSDKMSVLIKDLLNYATIQPAALKYQQTDLNAVLRSVMDDLDVSIVGKNAKINAAKLPVIAAIPLQVNQLFYNLLNNSLKFAAADRTPEISITAKQISKEQIQSLQLVNGTAYWKLQFADNGIGFNDVYAGRIFTIFQRLNSKDSYPGTGIGLALCKKVVDNHQGVIYAEGQENAGATFTVILPEVHI